MITVVFAVYVVSLLAALLTVGGLSDYVGRRPVILAALLLNGAAMILFARAGDVGQLILARAVQGRQRRNWHDRRWGRLSSIPIAVRTSAQQRHRLPLVRPQARSAPRRW